MRFNDHIRIDRDGVYFLDVYIEGRRKRPSLNTRNRRVAEERAAERLKELNGATAAEVDSTRLYKFLEKYVEHAKKQAEWSEQYKKNAEWMIGVFKSLVSDMPARRFTKAMADKFFGDLSERKRRVYNGTEFVERAIGPRGKNLYRRLFIAIWNLGITWDIIEKDKNVWSMVTKFREPKKRPRYLVDSEVNAILAQYAIYYPAEIPLIRVYLATGMRRSELLELTQAEVHFDTNQIIPEHTKFDKYREIPMAPVVREIMLSRKDLPRPFSDMPSARTVSNHFLEMRRLAGIHDAKLHDTRKRFITEAIRLGVPPTTVAEWAGHESIETTIEHYLGQDTVSHTKIESLGTYEGTATAEGEKIDLRTLHTDKPRKRPAQIPAHIDFKE